MCVKLGIGTIGRYMMSNKPFMQISDQVKNIPEALSVYMNNIVYKLKRDGMAIVTLSLGEAFFDVPFFGFDGLDITKGYHYSESLGIPELRDKIAKYYYSQYNAAVDSESEILISAGSKPLVYMALQSILNPGDEVLIHEPAWLSYPEQIKLANGIPRFIPYDCQVKDFTKYLSKKTRILILNNPNNPAGRVYSDEDLLMLYKEFRPRGIYIIVDEAYSDFLAHEEFCSIVNVVPDKDGIIVVNSLSKNLGMSGWRVGYVISTPEIIYNILKLNQHLITCASTILLMYLAKYFDSILEHTLPQAKAVTTKRNEIESYVRSIGLETLGGSSTFYMFVNIGGYNFSSLDLSLYLLFKYHIAVVPGSAYGKSTERFIRIGVGVETNEVIMRAIDRIKDVIENQEYDDVFVESELKRIQVRKFSI